MAAGSSTGVYGSCANGRFAGAGATAAAGAAGDATGAGAASAPQAHGPASSATAPRRVCRGVGLDVIGSPGRRPSLRADLHTARGNREFPLLPTGYKPPRGARTLMIGPEGDHTWTSGESSR